MKIKALLVAFVLGISSQASFAATDTSCNPFERGANCDGSGYASFSDIRASFGELRVAIRSRGHFGVETRARNFAKRNKTFAQMVRGIKRARRIEVLELRRDGAPERGAPIVIVDGGTTTPDNGGIGTDMAVVPLPAAGFLLLAGLGGLVVLRRKKD